MCVQGTITIHSIHQFIVLFLLLSWIPFNNFLFICKNSPILFFLLSLPFAKSFLPHSSPTPCPHTYQLPSPDHSLLLRNTTIPPPPPQQSPSNSNLVSCRFETFERYKLLHTIIFAGWLSIRFSVEQFGVDYTVTVLFRREQKALSLQQKRPLSLAAGVLSLSISSSGKKRSS